MINPKINYFIEILMIICGVFVAITSTIIGDDGGESIFTDVHHFFGIALLILIGIHILLHIKFIVAMTKNLFKRKKD